MPLPDWWGLLFRFLILSFALPVSASFYVLPAPVARQVLSLLFLGDAFDVFDGATPVLRHLALKRSRRDAGTRGEEFRTRATIAEVVLAPLQERGRLTRRARGTVSCVLRVNIFQL